MTIPDEFSNMSSSWGCRYYQGVLDAYYNLALGKLRVEFLQTLQDKSEKKLQQAERSKKKLQKDIECLSSMLKRAGQ